MAVGADLIGRAQAGNDAAFAELLSPYQRELQVHCYRLPVRRQLAPPAGSAAERVLVAQLTRAYEMTDIDEPVTLLADDILLTMPPIPLEYEGRELVARFLAAVISNGACASA